MPNNRSSKRTKALNYVTIISALTRFFLLPRNFANSETYYPLIVYDYYNIQLKRKGMILLKTGTTSSGAVVVLREKFLSWISHKSQRRTEGFFSRVMKVICPEHFVTGVVSITCCYTAFCHENVVAQRGKKSHSGLKPLPLSTLKLFYQICGFSNHVHITTKNMPNCAMPHFDLLRTLKIIRWNFIDFNLLT